MILIGSRALQYQLGRLGTTFPFKRTGIADLDFIANGGEAYEFARYSEMKVLENNGSKIVGRLKDGMMCEIEIARTGDSTRLYLMWADMFGRLDTVPLYGTEVQVASLEMLYSIKKAHRHSPRKFHTHVVDYNWLRAVVGKDIFPKVTELRLKETKERDKLVTPSLKKSKTEFFDDSVSNKTFIHDEIHEVMAHGPRPMFEKIRISPEGVACSVDKWNDLWNEDKRKCVQEEAYVIALERGVIPMLFEGGPIASPEAAYKWAVMRICTTLTSGWFREWALEHYTELMVHYNPAYVQIFLKAVEDGKIKRIETTQPALSEQSGTPAGGSELESGSGTTDGNLSAPIEEPSASTVREEPSVGSSPSGEVPVI